nr:MAG TPA: hypothetical protein [Caudoviricetes sp.]
MPVNGLSKATITLLYILAPLSGFISLLTTPLLIT